MADWLIRSPEEHIEYDVDVLFGPWPSHPDDTTLVGLRAHLAHHRVANALVISTRGALFSDREGNAETLAVTYGSSPAATSRSGQVRAATGAPSDGGPAGQGSSPSATSRLDEVRAEVGSAEEGTPVGEGSSPSATSPLQGEAGRAPAARAAALTSSPAETSPGQLDTSSPELRNTPAAEPRDAPSLESRDAPPAEPRDVSMLELRGAPPAELRDASSVEPRDASTLELRGVPPVEARDASTPEQRGASSEVRLIPVGTVDLRDPTAAADQLDELTEQGVKFLRLFTVQQGVAGDTPGYRHVIEQAVDRKMVLLQDGDPRKFGDVLAGRNADVIFLDLHVYLLGDFILMAKQEKGFKATTRMLSSPDGIERVVETVGARHLVFGSRTPFMDVSPQTLRLRYARISAEDRALIAGGNIRELLGA